MSRSIFSQRSNEQLLQANRNWDELFARVFWNPFRHKTPEKVDRPQTNQTIDRHNKKTPKENRCSICKKRFRWPKDLTYHHAYHHSGKKLNVCPEPTCGRFFQFPFQLATHRRLAEHHDWQVSCKVCGKRFGATNHLSRHTPASCNKYKAQAAYSKKANRTAAAAED